MPRFPRTRGTRVVLSTTAVLAASALLLAANEFAGAAELTAAPASAAERAPAAGSPASSPGGGHQHAAAPAGALSPAPAPAAAKTGGGGAGSMADMDHVSEFASTIRWNTVATRSGNWDDPQVWNTGAPPAAGSDVRIPSGMTMTVRNAEKAAVARIFAEGSLDFATDRDTSLTVDTLLVGSTGHLSIGTAAKPLASGRTAEIVIAASAQAPLDRDVRTRGVLVSGTIETHAPERTSKVALAEDVSAGANQLVLASKPNWAVGDSVVVTGTFYRAPVAGSSPPDLESEVRHVTAVNGARVTVDKPLQHDHQRARAGLSVYVSDLTRPITITSANPGVNDERGHVMVMSGGRANIDATAFDQLGRTQKALDLSAQNVIAVYPLHFHRAGYDVEQHVNNVAIWGTPGWGLVNHSSNVVATDNVVHDFVGSAYVTEAGDELGAFRRNIASGGTNAPSGGKVVAREAISGPQRARMVAGDMGKFANGFWLAGPNVAVTDNVVADSRGTAYLIFGMGEIENGHMTGIPLDRFPAGTNPRTWAEPNQFNGVRMGLVNDMPVSEFRGNTAYGVFQGLRIRWSNDSGGFLLTRGATQLDAGIANAIQGPSSGVTRRVSTLSGLTFWNVASGVNAGYSGGFDLKDVHVLNAKGYDPGCPDSQENSVCAEQGISLSDGMGGNTTKIIDSTVDGISNPLILGIKGDQTLTNVTLDGVTAGNAAAFKQ